MWIIFLASTIYIATKAFQQLNVVGGHVFWVIPTSYLMAFMEVLIISKIAMTQSVWTAIPLGTGAALGCLFAMWMHKKYVRA